MVREPPSDQLGKEANNLTAISQQKALTTPKVIAEGSFKEIQYLLLEYLVFKPAQVSAMVNLGKGLAKLHQISHPQFGWPEDNYAGPTPQLNTPHESWLSFFRENRLIPQIELASKNGLRLRGVDHLLTHLDQWIRQDQCIKPALLHGDLWSGNIGFINGTQPALYDPACYYGDPEVDLAMTHLFGGFDQSFYNAYYSIIPVREGHDKRQLLYNLYPILNHYILFGGHYGQLAQQTIDQLIN